MWLVARGRARARRTMMMWESGWWVGGLVWMVLFWGLLVAGIVWLVRAVMDDLMRGDVEE